MYSSISEFEKYAYVKKIKINLFTKIAYRVYDISEGCHHADGP